MADSLAHAEYISTTVRLDMFVADKEAGRTREHLDETLKGLEALRGEVLATSIEAAEGIQLPLFV